MDTSQIILVSEIGDNRTLPPIGGVVIGGFTFSMVALNPGWTPFAGPIAIGAFHLDHVGAEVGEDLASPRPCQDARKFEDFQPGKGSVRVARGI